MSDKIILTGFMGTGKSTVGMEVARRLDLPFVEMDAEIEALTEKPISAIFSEDGEPAFREMEAELCQELAATAERAVIATGGGTLVVPKNRALMEQSGLVICLDASPGEILQRLDKAGDRPLLDVSDRRAEVGRLLSARREAYGAVPWHIDTTDLSVEETARRVLDLVEATSLRVHHPEGAYQIRMGTGLLRHSGGAARAAGIPPGTRVALVSDDVVAPLYAAQVEEALHATGLHSFRCVLPDGEEHKTLATVAWLYEQFLSEGLDREGVVLALGGGVTGDIAGFAAATYMRGVQFVQVPTSLLAMVDASVGGKTAVDLPQGKNLVGAFKQPACVTIDPAVLQTLEEVEIRSGMTEVIKHSIIGDPDLFRELSEAGRRARAGDRLPLPSAEQVARALRVKIAVVEEDPYERDRRAVLNLGHTVGHALEKLSDFRLRHGEAVSVGIAAATQIAVRLGLADPSMREQVEATLTAWGLPVRCFVHGEGYVRTEALWQAMAHDKKRRGDRLRWVLPVTLGEVTIRDDVPEHIVLKTLREMGAT